MRHDNYFNKFLFHDAHMKFHDISWYKMRYQFLLFNNIVTTNNNSSVNIHYLYVELCIFKTLLFNI